MKHKQLNEINRIDEFLVKYQDRSCTDVCCAVTGIVYSLILFILAIALFNYDHFFRANFPSDSDGRLCGIDEKLTLYPYVYFVNPPDMSRRVCVSSCPMENDQQIKCIPTEQIGCHYNNKTGYQVVKYENYERKTRSGFFCYPEQEKLRNQLLENSNLASRDQFFNSIDTISLCFFVSFAFCVAYLLAVQFVKKINFIIVVLGWLITLACLICVITYNSSLFSVKLSQTIILGVALLVIAFWLWRNHQDLQVYDIFLRRAANMVKSKPSTLLYIPIFVLILYAFIVIVVLEFTAFWSSGYLIFDHTIQLFYEPHGGGTIILTILLAIQLIWGLSFLKLAFNFLVSTQAVFWLYNRKIGFFYPFKLLLCKHFGSVVAGAFMTGFFSIGDFIFDAIAPKKHQLDETATGCKGLWHKIYSRSCGKVVNFFDLVREDAMAYVSLTGNPYCNSSRYCEYLYNNSHITDADSNQSISRCFRVMAHLLIAGTMVIFGLYVKGDISVYALFIIFLLGIFTSTFFISLHGDTSEALQILYLADEQFTNNRKNIASAKVGNADEKQIAQSADDQLKIIKKNIEDFKAEKMARKNKTQKK